MGQVICMGIFNPNFYVTYVFPGQQVDLGLSVSWEGVESRGRVNLEGGKMICMGQFISSFHVEKGKACAIFPSLFGVDRWRVLFEPLQRAWFEHLTCLDNYPMMSSES